VSKTSLGARDEPNTGEFNVAQPVVEDGIAAVHVLKTEQFNLTTDEH
jgi:hypothetical protein